MKRSFLLLVGFFLFSCYSSGQAIKKDAQIMLESHTLIVPDDNTPFWMEMNRLGRIRNKSTVQQVLVVDGAGMQVVRNGKFRLSYGTTLIGRLSESSSLYPEQYWGKAESGPFYFLVGARAEPVWQGGLSHTNGDFFLSNNARPLPRAELGFDNFRPFSSGWLNRFSFHLRYAEYWLIDDQYVKHANLHHKKMLIGYQANPDIDLSFGLDHWVFWGGTSPDPEVGKLPGFKYYWRYVLGASGGEDSPLTDQENVSGNHLGQWLFRMDIRRPEYILTFNYQHLFEDGSGSRFVNKEDGFWGLSVRFRKDRPLVAEMLLEYTNTTDQSGPYHKYVPDPDNPDEVIGVGRDNYFNHSVYKSGFVSYGRMIGSPLFVPVIVDGISEGFRSTRLRGIHGGMCGYLSDYIYWSGKATYSRYYGNYDNPFSRYKDLISLNLSCRFQAKQKPVSWEIRLSADRGDYRPESVGCEFSVYYQLR